MSALRLGAKNLMEITACTVDKSGTVTIDESDKFEVMINPASYKFENSISFNSSKSQGEIGNRKQFSRMNDSKVSFSLVIDGTGVVNSLGGGIGSTDVKTQVNKVSKVLGYDGDEHEPKHSRLVWGSLIFFGRMTSMSTDYSVFKPSGDPLRAKVTLSFSGFMTDKEESLKANRSSPDLSHIVEVMAGDTLPSLCNRIYKDSSYYIEVAKINKISNFRSLNAGDQLLFPPLS